MHHVISLSAAKDREQEQVWPLEVPGRMRFDTGHAQTLGYFRLLSPRFEEYAQRDARIGIEAINVSFYLQGEDLSNTLRLLEELDHEIAGLPESWRVFLGIAYCPGKEPQRIEPLLFRRRAMLIVARLRALAVQAAAQSKMLVYGNGVFYRPYCGIKPVLGTFTYS